VAAVYKTVKTPYDARELPDMVPVDIDRVQNPEMYAEDTPPIIWGTKRVLVAPAHVETIVIPAKKRLVLMTKAADPSVCGY
jgi:hypothetical protein